MEFSNGVTRKVKERGVLDLFLRKQVERLHHLQVVEQKRPGFGVVRVDFGVDALVVKVRRVVVPNQSLVSPVDFVVYYVVQDLRARAVDAGHLPKIRAVCSE